MSFQPFSNILRDIVLITLLSEWKHLKEFVNMKLSIRLKDFMIAPGKRFDPSAYSEEDVLKRIRTAYGVIAEVMDISIQGDMVNIEFKNATPEKSSEAIRRLGGEFHGREWQFESGQCFATSPHHRPRQRRFQSPQQQPVLESSPCRPRLREQ